MSYVTFEIDGKQHIINMYEVENEDEFRSSLEFDGVRDATKRDLAELTKAVAADNALLRGFISDEAFDLSDYIRSMECIDGKHEAAEAFMQTRIAAGNFDARTFRICHEGEYASEDDFARANALAFLNISKGAFIYIDMERYATDLFSYDFEFVDGHVFRVI